MLPFLLFLLAFTQEPSTADLLRRLDADEIAVREESELALVARGAPALKEVEAALSTAKEGELRIRLQRVVRKLRLADLVARIPSQFSEAFRAAAPELIARLKKPEPEVLVEAIAVTTGRAWHWDQVDKETPHGSMKVAREIVRGPIKDATRSDVAEILHLALLAVPEGPRSPPWAAAQNSAWAAIKPAESHDRRCLFMELFRIRQDPNVRNIVEMMVRQCRVPDDTPMLLAALDDQDPKMQELAAWSMIFLDAGPHADQVEKRLASVRRPLRRCLLYPLKRTGDRRFLKTFEEYMHSSELDERIVSREAIQALDPDSMPRHALKWLKSGDPARITEGLKFCDPDPRVANPVLVPELLAEVKRIFADHGDKNYRPRAFAILIRLQPDNLKDMVLGALADHDPMIRKQAIAAAGRLQGPEIVKALNQILEKDDDLALDAALALMSLKEAPSLDRIRGFLKSATPAVRSRAMYAIVCALQEKSRDDLLPLLEDPKPEIQASAVYYLGSWPAGIEDRLRKMLDSPHEAVADAAARVMSRLGDKACLPHLRKKLGTHQWREFLPVFVGIAEPEWSKVLNGIVFKLPDQNPTGESVVEGIRANLKDKGIELRVELAPESLKRGVGPILQSGVGFGIGWIRTMIMGSDYFFDGKVLFILPHAEARKRWLEWAKFK